jgi:hypothetical protein
VTRAVLQPRSVVIGSSDKSERASASLRAPIVWGMVVGVLQAFSPAGFWWLEAELTWALGLVIIAPIYIGLAVADGRARIIAVEVVVATFFVIVAIVAIELSPWLAVAGLVGHGLKDLWQHRTHFVANTRWWPPFCLVVDLVAASVIAVLVLTGVDLGS